MEEELQLLLEQADNDGYDDNQKLDVIKWYQTSRPAKNTTPSSEDYIFNKYKDSKPDTPGAIKQLGIAAYSAVADQLPSAMKSSEAMKTAGIDDSSYDFLNYIKDQTGIEDLHNQVYESNISNPFLQSTSGDNTTSSLGPKEQAKLKEIIGESNYNNLYKEFSTQNKERTKELLKESDIQDAEGEARTKGFTKEFGDVHNAGDVVRYISEGAGQGIGSTAASVLSGGISSYYQESGPAYKESLEETAKAMTETSTNGTIWTKEMVVDGGFDKKAREYAHNVGLINAGLENIGTLITLGASGLFVKKAAEEMAKPAIRKILTATGKGLAGEFTTEFLQESNTQYAVLKAAGHTDGEIFGKDGNAGLFDWERPLNAGVKGAAGGGVMAGTGSTVSAIRDKASESKTEKAITENAKENIKVEEKKAKVEEKLAIDAGIREAKEEKANTIIDETTNPEINTGEDDTDNDIASIKALIEEKKRNEESAKLKKEEDKIEEGKEKIVDTAFKEKEKLDKIKAKEAEKADEKTEQVVEEAPKAEVKASTEETKVETKKEAETVVAEKTPVKKVPKVLQPKLPVTKKVVDLTPEQKQEKVDIESNKLNKQFVNVMGLKKPSQKLERLLNVKSNIEKANHREEHNELFDRVDSEIAKLQQTKEAKTEAKVLKPVKVVKVKSEEQIADENAIDLEIEELNTKKAAIVNKYGELRTKTGQVIKRATPQTDDSGKLLWNPQDLDDVRAHNKRLDELRNAKKKANRTPEQEEAYKIYKDEGVDEDVANALTDPDEENNLGVQDIGIADKITEDSLKKRTKWENLTELTHAEYVGEIKKYLPKYEGGIDSNASNSILGGIWDKAIYKMFGVIRQASEKQGKNVRFFYGDNPSGVQGTAFRDNGNLFVFLKRGVEEATQRKDQTQLHEFVHLFEYAGHQLEILTKQKDLKGDKKFNNDILSRSSVSRKVDKIHSNLIDETLTRLNGLYKILSNDPKGVGQAFANNFGKLSSSDQLLLLHLFNGRLDTFSIGGLKNIIFQLEEHKKGQILMNKAARAVTQDEYNSIANEYSKLMLSAPVYGFKNGREMVAEGMSNPYFMGFLASTKSAKNSTITFLEDIYNALVEILNHFSESLAKNYAVIKYGIKLPTYSEIKKSYLNEILSTMRKI